MAALNPSLSFANTPHGSVKTDSFRCGRSSFAVGSRVVLAVGSTDNVELVWGSAGRLVGAALPGASRTADVAVGVGVNPCGGAVDRTSFGSPRDISVDTGTAVVTTLAVADGVVAVGVGGGEVDSTVTSSIASLVYTGAGGAAGPVAAGRSGESVANTVGICTEAVGGAAVVVAIVVVVMGGASSRTAAVCGFVSVGAIVVGRCDTGAELVEWNAAGTCASCPLTAAASTVGGGSAVVAASSPNFGCD